MQPPPSFDLLYIPLFPLLGAVFNLLFGRAILRTFGDRLGREIVHLVAIAAVAFSCFFTISAVFEVMVGQGHGRLVQQVYPWILSGETMIGFDLLLDHLSAVMCLVVTGVGLLIHIFSVGYMAKDPDYHRYFAYLNLFMASMLILVLGKSLVLTFVGWEGVGLCSYLLIGFWFTDDAKATAGRKAFIMNRIGDFGFIIGMLLIYSVVQSLDFDAIHSMSASEIASPFTKPLFHIGSVNVNVATVATICLFIGCCGKSAQIPLHTWLPDAMAGPTPVSALIHAATMVTAGVYLIVRMNFLFALAPLTMGIVAVIGATTALFAATIGITQNDIKKVLAYSTVSQLGFMFIAAGMGAWVAAIFHLVTHAFFKACLFLGSGAVIEACHHNQDIRTMGGLKEKMPATRWTFLISCLAISGIVPFSGFFSKDEILLHAYVNESVWSPGLNWFAYGMGAVAAFCTAFYMFRLYFLTFEGEFRGDHHTWIHYVKEHWIMSLPLLILAGLATFGGLLGWPHAFPFAEHATQSASGRPIMVGLPHILEQWLEPITATSARFSGEFFVGPQQRFLHEGHISSSIEYAMMGVSLAIAAAGIYAAWRLYSKGPSQAAADIAAKLGLAYRASKAKYWVDEIYDLLIVRPVRALGSIFYHAGDQGIIDGVGIGGVTGVVSLTGEGVRRWHNGNVRRYLAIFLVGVAVVLGSVYLNPRISQVGRSEVGDNFDPGGLRPTIGDQNVKVKLLGFIEIPWFTDETDDEPSVQPPGGDAPAPAQPAGGEK